MPSSPEQTLKCAIFDLRGPQCFTNKNKIRNPTSRASQVPSCPPRGGLMQRWEGVGMLRGRGIPLLDKGDFKVSKFQSFWVSWFLVLLVSCFRGFLVYWFPSSYFSKFKFKDQRFKYSKVLKLI